MAVAVPTRAALCGCLGLPLDSTGVPRAGHNALFLAGLALCARPVWPLTVAPLGFRSSQDPYFWAVLPGTLHAAASAAVLLLGPAATARGPRSTP